jgi:predicted dehydrogenase
MTLRIGILGSGEMGRAYGELVMHHTKGIELVAIGGGTRATELAAHFGVSSRQSQELITSPDIDAVVVATPPSSHAAYAHQAMDAGKHVHLEKPMALTPAECDGMIRKARASNRVLSVSSVMRYRGTITAARKAIDAGLIGDPRLIRATFEWVRYDFGSKPWHLDRTNGSPSLNCVSHIHDVIRLLAGDAVRATSMETSFAGAPAARTAVSQFTLANGGIADVWITYELPPPGLGSSCKYLVVGSLGILDIDGYGQVRLGRGADWELLYEQPAFRYRDLVADAADLFGPLRLRAFADQFQEFERAVTTGRPLAFTAADARAGVAMVDAAERAAEQGRMVRVSSSVDDVDADPADLLVTDPDVDG